MGNYNLRHFVLLSTVFLFFTLNLKAQLLAPAKGFNVFVKNNITLGPADIEGGFAAGGNFIFSPDDASSPSNYAGNANAGGTGNPYGTVSGTNYAAVIGGSISWSPSNDHFDFNNIATSRLVKFGSVNGGSYSNTTKRITSGSKYLQINGTTSQTSTSNYVQSGIINFTTEFNTLGATSSCLSSKAQTVTTPTGNSWNINLSSLANNKIHILNITGAQLNALSSFEVSGASSTKILVINVNSGSSFSMNTINQNSLTQAPYILWNFYNATTLSIPRLVGSLLAPLANVTKPSGANNIDGQVVALSYTQLSGETHINSFNSSLTCTSCTATGGTIASSQTFCGSGDPNLFTSSVAASATSGTTSLTWESSTDSANWTTISGATSSTYNAGVLSQTTWFRRKITSTNECFAYSNIVKVTITSSPVISECEAQINGTWSVLANCTATVCTGNSLTLSVNPNAPSGYTQSWTGPNSFSKSGNDALVSNSVTSSHAGVYTYTLTNGVCTTTKTITVVVNNCCDGKVASLYFNKLDGGTDIAISNGGTYNISTLGSLYNLEAGTTGTVESVKFTITGPSSSSNNIENTIPWNSPGGSTAFVPVAGTYNILVETFTADNGGGTNCHDSLFTITFSSPDCNCPSNLVQNSSFENGTTNWTPAGPYSTFQADNFAAQCGSNSGQMDGTSNTNLASFYQDITLSAGSTIQLKFKAGTHVASDVAKFGLIFFNGNTRLDSSLVEVDHILGSGTMADYTINATAPGGTTKVRVIGKVGVDWLKVDLVCLTATTLCNTNAGADGSKTVCENTSIINLATVITGASSGGSWTRISGSGGTFVGGTTGTFIPDNNAVTSTFRYVVTGISTCPNDTSIATVTVKNVGSPAVASGSQTACTNSPIQYCAVLDASAQYYEWNFGSGASPSTSKNRCETVQWSTAGSKTITLYLLSADGCISETINYNVTVTDCACTAKVTGLNFKNASNTLPVPNGSTFNISTVSGLYYFEAVTSGTVGSVKFNITGPSASTVTDNSTPFRAPSSSNWTGALGNYSVNIKTYSAANATGSLCHDTTITFSLVDPNCCTNSILVNPSFETSNGTNTTGGTYGWSPSGNSDFYSGTGYVMCGNYNSFLDAGGSTKSFYQQVNGVLPGNTYSLTIWGGTHEPSFNHSFLLSFYNASNVRLSRDSVQVDFDVDLAGGLQMYTLGGTAPAGTSYLRVEGKGTGDYLKVDMACLTLTGTAVNLGDKVWFDQNNNGLQDAGEPGIAGASVQLYSGAGVAIGSPVITGSNGLYSFTNLAAGDYIVGVTPPAGFTSSSVNGGDPDTDTDNNDDNGSVVNGSEIRSLAITLTSGGEPTTDGDGNNGNLTVDFGFVGIGSIGDLVWNDKDGDGIQDGAGNGETGVAGVIATLTYTYNGVLFTVKDTTDASGLYLFTNLPADGTTSYTIVFSNIPNGLNLTTSNAAGSNDNNDSDGLTPPSLTLPASTPNNTSVDLGLYASVNLGNYVWYDIDNNGIQDPGEPAILNAIVKLYDATGITQIGTSITTGTNGEYNFTNLKPGTYVVGVTPPTGFKSSGTDAGDPDNDPDNNDDNGIGLNTGEVKSLPITLVSGSEPTNDGDGNNGNLTVDFGFTGTGSIGDLVWSDKNGNGLQNMTTESGVPGVIVSINFMYNNAIILLYDTTDTNGKYLFQNLPPGSYTVEFENNTAMSVTMTNQGSDDEGDSDGLTPPGVILTSGQNILNIDLGLMETTAAIGNFVWNDLNADGDQDAGEPGIGGVSVTLTNVTTNATTNVNTGTNGKYLFTGLAPGTYKVTFGTPAGGYNQTTSNVAADNIDSDAGAGGMTGNYTLVAGQEDTSVDAGFYMCPTLNLRDTGVCGTFSINLNANIPSLLQGGTWVNDGTPVNNPTAVNWTGTFIYQKTSGACTIKDTMVIYRDVPDYTSRVTIYPNVIVGPSPVDVVITVAEENNKSSCMPLYVGIPIVLERFTVNYNPNLTSLSGQSLNNSEFNYIGIIDGYHFWQYVGNGGIFPANGLKKFGISGLYNNLGTTGYTTFSCFVTLGSGGEVNFNNNFSGTTLFFNN